MFFSWRKGKRFNVYISRSIFALWISQFWHECNLHFKSWTLFNARVGFSILFSMTFFPHLVLNLWDFWVTLWSADLLSTRVSFYDTFEATKLHMRTNVCFWLCKNAQRNKLRCCLALKSPNLKGSYAGTYILTNSRSCPQMIRFHIKMSMPFLQKSSPEKPYTVLLIS